ncbi:hypothetical protein GQ53DRAFT_78120 [Thozetella sp. PMI_491]|nr:hypothetical protein GQ53DRAFT_78120 [Thozetella sp. PMI_491]
MDAPGPASGACSTLSVFELFLGQPTASSSSRLPLPLVLLLALQSTVTFCLCRSLPASPPLRVACCDCPVLCCTVREPKLGLHFANSSGREPNKGVEVVIRPKSYVGGRA